MTCAEALDLIGAKIDKELTPEQDAQLQAHLNECAECRAVYEAMAGIERGLAELEEPAPEGLKQGVMYRIGQETGKNKKPKKRWIGPGTGFGLVAAVLVLLIGLNVIPLGTKRTAADMAVGHYGAEAQGANEYYTNAPEAAEDATKASGLSYAPTDVMGGLKNGHRAETGSPEQASETDNYYQEGRTDETPADGLRAEVPMDDELRAMGSGLSEERGAAVLVYTEFSMDSLTALLEKEEPELYAHIKLSEPERLDNGYLVCKTDYRTVLAVHEWLLSNLPQSETMPDHIREAETDLMIRMQELDPGSGSLYSVITWTPRQRPVSWPASWPAGWAVRLRTEENWSLFFPAEGFTAKQDDTAWLVFPPEDR